MPYYLTPRRKPENLNLAVIIIMPAKPMLRDHLKFIILNRLNLPPNLSAGIFRRDAMKCFGFYKIN
jgi:hypothetical protein